MLTSPYKWKILEWDEKPQANKQTNKQIISKQNLGLQPNKKWEFKQLGKSWVKYGQTKLSRVIASQRMEINYVSRYTCLMMFITPVR